MHTYPMLKSAIIGDQKYEEQRYQTPQTLTLLILLQKGVRIQQLEVTI
jgi:hypothetical protein